MANDTLPPGIGLGFTETMRGFWTQDPALDFQAAFDQGRAGGRNIEFTLTIETDDLARFLSEPAHECGARGTVTAPALSTQPLRVQTGRFNLFVNDPDRVGVRLMRYRLSLVADDGARYFLDGTKTIRDDRGPDIWPDTTTLVIKVYCGSDDSGQLLGVGILHILVPDFAKQLGTVKISNAPDRLTELRAVLAFGRFFAGVIFDTYGTIAAPLQVFNPDAPPRQRRPLNAPMPELHSVQASDGVPLRLTRYRAGAKGPVMLAHGLGVSSGIFSTDTIDQNLVEFLAAAGYDIWLLDYRASIALPSAQSAFSGDEIALRDFPATVDAILEATGAASIQAIVHCFGATTFTMAVLAGLQGVRSAVISQVATHAVVGPVANLKAGLHVPSLLDQLGVKTLTAAASKGDSAFTTFLDETLRVQEPRLSERCSSATCHRISFMYAPLYQHAQLNTLLHDCLHELFGVGNMKAFEHLATIIRKGHVIDANGQEAYMPNIARLAAMPMTIVHGAKNECYLPESTQRTLDLLQKTAPNVARARHVIPEYGHIDCIFGKNAAKDVYPKMLEHLETIGA